MSICCRILLSALYVLVCCKNLHGQSFKSFTEIDDVPIEATLGITQDKDGFMWFGTTRGLVRYDTRTFKYYKTNQGAAFADIRDVYTDLKGNVWVATASGLSVYNPKTDRFTHFKSDSVLTNSLSNDFVQCIKEDNKGHIWVGTQHGLTRIVNDDGNFKFSRVLQKEFTASTLQIKCLAQDNTDNLWAGTSDGLVKISPTKAKQNLYRMQTVKGGEHINEFRAIYTDSSAMIWLGNSSGGLIKFDPKNENFTLVEKFKNPNGQYPNIYKIISDGKGKLLIATSSGLAVFNPLTQESNWYVNRPGDSHSLPDNTLFSIYRDRQGGVWCGSYYIGVSYVHLDAPQFTQWPFFSPDPRSIVFKNAWVGKSKSGLIWSISDKVDKLLIFDANGKNPSALPLQLSALANYYAFYLDENRILWAGGNSILTRFDTRTKQYRHYKIISGGNTKPENGRTYTLFEDSYKHFWVGGVYGLLLFDKRSGTFKKDQTVVHAATVYEDSKHQVWFGGYKGLYKLAPQHAKQPLPRIEKIQSLSDFPITWKICEDHQGKIWAASHTSLLCYNPSKNKFELNTDVPKEAVLDVIVDKKGYLWINASYKLYRYHPMNRTLQSYGYQDGLPSKGVLMQASAVEDRGGKLYYASNEGMFWFDPLSISAINRYSPVILSALKLYNQEVKVGDATGLLSEPIEKTKEIAFKHDQRIFTLDFAILDFIRSNANKYAYKIEGIDRGWNYVQTPSATYTNLPSGTYTFQFKAANSDGFWTKEPLKLKIRVLPPWWKTWYAYLFYILLISAIVYAVTRFFWFRSTFRRESALNQLKLDFFTNVSHEIRTHLSLINGPLLKAHQQSKEGQNNEKYLRYAQDSSDRLMLLVNELLDFRKIQSGGVKLRVQQHDVIKMIEGIMAAFEHVAKEKDIQTSLLYDKQPVLLWFDMAQMQKVFYNLLGNAFKFTPETGKVLVQITENDKEVNISIQDNGKGIASEYLEKLFTYFYQADSQKPGYGIGLALSKSIVEEHKGDLSVQSQLTTPSSQGGTVFNIRMLTGKGHFSDDQILQEHTGSLPNLALEPNPVYDQENITTSKHRSTILIIEDNGQLRVFIREIFEEAYHVLEAENGLVGLEMANEHIPDIILCDVMMPQMTGLQLAEKLKTDVNTAHIPLVLLTARTQNEQLIEGLAAGADDYLLKPFDPRVLLLKINNLIRLKEDLREHYRRSILSPAESGESIANDLNQAFLTKLKTLVKENISDPNFGVNELSVLVGMSVSVLYRKMRSISGMTINEFVKTIRLDHAKKLLETGLYNVNEVATMIGFEDSKYFSKEFRKVFGKTPNEIKKSV